MKTEDRANGWVYQLHFMGNRCVIADTGEKAGDAEKARLAREEAESLIRVQ